MSLPAYCQEGCRDGLQAPFCRLGPASHCTANYVEALFDRELLNCQLTKLLLARPKWLEHLSAIGIIASTNCIDECSESLLVRISGRQKVASPWWPFRWAIPNSNGNTRCADLATKSTCFELIEGIELDRVPRDEITKAVQVFIQVLQDLVRKCLYH